MRVTIQNFQSLRATTVEVEGLTVLVGPSHRGKSAFIRAVEGALFNRPGDQFVREGASKATVTIEGLPTVAETTLDVVWVKGKNANQYTVNGVVYGKVGTGAPPPIDEAGYRDVWIGDKERKKGSYIRPQVANQFDPLFLLTETGSFVSDVLSVISRHAVILTAQGRCGSDLKSVKQLAGVRRTDRDEEARKLTVLDGVPSLVAGVEALVEEGRLVEDSQQRLATLRMFVLRRRASLPLSQVRVPEATTVAGDLGHLVARARELWTRRTRLMQAILPVPENRVAALAPVAIERIEDLERAARLVRRRRNLLAMQAELPTAFAEKVPRLQPWQEKAEVLARLTGRRTMVLVQIQRAEAAHQSVITEEERVQAELAETLSALDVCPLCEQEISHANFG